jgi:hypothetical protein
MEVLGVVVDPEVAVVVVVPVVPEVIMIRIMLILFPL